MRMSSAVFDHEVRPSRHRRRRRARQLGGARHCRGRRIADNRAQTVADSVMYREALATAAEARGWAVHWYDREQVFRDAAAALGREDVDAFLHAMGRSIGPPWQAKHKLAAAAALAAAGRPRRA
jgi:hypothetical protein